MIRRTSILVVLGLVPVLIVALAWSAAGENGTPEGDSHGAAGGPVAPPDPSPPADAVPDDPFAEPPVTDTAPRDPSALPGYQPGPRDHYPPPRVLARKRIEEALEAAAHLEFVETPLNEVVEYLNDYYQVEVVLDEQKLREAGIRNVEPVTVDLRGVPLGFALKQMLQPMGLGWTLDENLLVITSEHDAAKRVYLEVYDVGDLVTCRGEHGELWEDYDTLVEVIERTIAPAAWDSVGGPGAVCGATFGPAKVLIVSQSGVVHRQIRLFLARLREVAAEQSVREGPPWRPRPKRAAERATGQGFAGQSVPVGEASPDAAGKTDPNPADKGTKPQGTGSTFF